MADRPPPTDKITGFSRNFTRNTERKPKPDSSSEKPASSPSVKEVLAGLNLNRGVLESPFAGAVEDAPGGTPAPPQRPLTEAPPISPRSPRLQSPRSGAASPLATSPRQQPRISADDAKTYLENWVKHEISSDVVNKLRSGKKLDDVFRDNPSLTLNDKNCPILEFIEGYFGAILPESRIDQVWADCRGAVLNLIKDQQLTAYVNGKQVLTAETKKIVERLMNAIRGQDQSLASSALPPEVKEFLLHADTLVQAICERNGVSSALTRVTRGQVLTGLLFTRILSVIWTKDMQGGVSLFLGQVNSNLNLGSKAFMASIMQPVDLKMRMREIAHSRKNTDTSGNLSPRNALQAKARNNQLIKEVIAVLPSASDPAQTKALRGHLQEVCKARPDISLEGLKDAAQRFLLGEASDFSSSSMVSPDSDSSPEKST